MRILDRLHNVTLRRGALFSLLLFVMALAPRLFALGRYITPDELIWVYRSVQFRRALLSGRWLETLTAEHPGVITTWLGTVAHSLQLTFDPTAVSTYQSLQKVAWFAPENVTALIWLAHFLTGGRIAVALVNSAGIVLIFWLTARLFNRTVALWAALLLALDPFLAGLSGLFHVDGLMTTFTAVSLLALAIVIQPEDEPRSRRGMTAVSGAAAALAVLAKSPAILLPAVAGLFLLLAAVSQARDWNGRLRRFWQQGTVWLGTYLVTLFVAFPALWTSPQAVFAEVTGVGSRHVESVLRPSFFLGSVTFTQGPIFYPVVLAFRLGPLVFLGIFLALGLIIWQWRLRRRQVVWSFGMMAVWALLFLIAITLAVKKFDRYVLPVIPIFILLAAYAWGTLPYPSRRWRRAVFAGLAVVQAAYLLYFSPYLLSAYNPLLGGPRVAAEVLPLGWGEGISAGARWLAGQPHVEEQTAVAAIAPALAPFFPGETVLPTDGAWQQADYAIITAGNRQGGQSGTAAWTADATLLHSIEYGGLTQAWVYHRPDPAPPPAPPAPLPQPLTFGRQVVLHGARAAITGEDVDLFVQWGLLPTGANGRYTVKLTLRDDDAAWTSVESELVNETYFRPQHWSPDEMPIIRYKLPLPPGIPPAVYDVSLSLFARDSGNQLPLTTMDGAFRGVEYPLAQISVPPAADPLSLNRLNVPEMGRVAMADDRLLLIGHDPLPETAVTGSHLLVDLYWQAQSSLPADLQVAWQIGDALLTTPLSRFPSAQWRPGEVIHEKYALSVPADLPDGPAPLSVQLLAADGTPLAEPVSLGAVAISAIDRLFALPNDIQQPLYYQFGSAALLRGVDLPDDTVAAGESFPITLYWEVVQAPSALVNAFMHVVDDAGQNVTQADRWPGGLPSDLWAPGQIIVDKYTIEIPAATPAGTYRLATGLYTAGDGVRLAAQDTSGAPVPDDRVFLPLSLTVETADE